MTLAPPLKLLKCGLLSMSNSAVIALGSNLGESEATLIAAAEHLKNTRGISSVLMSSLYTSVPAIVAQQPLFKNAVALITTSLSPHDLLKTLQEIELSFGRVREGSEYIPNGPRTLDLDIIDYEGVVLNDPDLVLPHPEALKRDFVVTPLLEISPHHVLANQKVVSTNTVECGTVLSPEEAADYTQVSYEITLSEAVQNTEGGCLYVCATPIGNLSDITLRVLETLQSADVIYCEDTRVTRKLTTRYDIKAPLKRADSHKLAHIIPSLLQELEEGKQLAFVSDAGMPGISDPGALLVHEARAAGFAVEVLPGASALTTALAASGIKAQNHFFGGFFPRKTGAGTRLLSELSALEDTVLVFFESVHRTAKTLRLIAEVLPARKVCLARELTKLHEEVLSAPAPELAALIDQRIAEGRALKGEVVLLIAPKEEP